MSNLIYFPGCEPKAVPPRSIEDIHDELATELLKVISATFIEERWEMGPVQVWYDEVLRFLDARRIDPNSLPSSIESALRDYKRHWRRQVIDFIEFEQRNPL